MSNGVKVMITRGVQFVENFFVPNPRNRWLPHGLSHTAFLAYVFLGFTLAASAVYLKTSQLASPVDIIAFQSKDVISLVNGARRASGLEPLAENTLLSRAAERKAYDMFNRQYFAHVTPDSKQPWIFIEAENYPYTAAGENLAIDFLSAPDAHAAFMNSPAHRANIVNLLYREIGVAVVPGTFEGRTSIIVVQFFAKPRSLTITPVASAASVPRQPVAPLAPLKPIQLSPSQIPVHPPPPSQFPVNPPPPAIVAQLEKGVSNPPPPLATAIEQDVSAEKVPTESRMNIPAVVSRSLQAVPAVTERLSLRSKFKLTSSLIIVLALLPIVFLFTRLHKPRRLALIRPALVIILFLYVGWFGPVPEIRNSSINETAASVVVLESRI